LFAQTAFAYLSSRLLDVLIGQAHWNSLSLWIMT